MQKVCPSGSTGDKSSGGKKPCKSTQFLPLGGADGSVVSDHQVIKIQEQASKLGVGSIPRSMLVVLEDDLVDSVKAGDQVVVVGILMRTWKPCVRGVRCDLETTIKANSIRIKMHRRLKFSSQRNCGQSLCSFGQSTSRIQCEDATRSLVAFVPRSTAYLS